MDNKKIFARESTGLVKEAGLLDAISINISDMSMGVALAVLGYTMMLLPSIEGVNLIVSSIIAFALSIPQIIVYTILVTKMPRAGGDYIWLSRAFGGAIGGSLALAFVVESLAYFALVSLSASPTLYSSLLAIGVNIPFLTSTLGTILVGVASFAAIVLINIFKPRYGFRLITALTLVSLAALIAAIIIYITAGRTNLVNAVNSLLPSGYNYQSIAGSYNGSTFNLFNTIMMIPFFAIFIYPWIQAGPSISSEIRGKGALKLNVVLASVITFILLTMAIASMYYGLSYPFVTAALSNSNVNYAINFWTVAIAAAHNPIVSWLLIIGSFTWEIAVLAYGVVVVARYIMAMGLDRYLPEVMSYVSPRLHSPIAAHIMDLAITTVLIIAAAYFYGTFTALYGAVVAAMIYYLAVGAAAVKHGLRSGHKLLIIAGALTAIVFAFITYQFLEYPSIWGGNWLAYGVEIATFIAGLGIYAVMRRHYSKKEGIDISLAYKEIPPE